MVIRLRRLTEDSALLPPALCVGIYHTLMINYGDKSGWIVKGSWGIDYAVSKSMSVKNHFSPFFFFPFSPTCKLIVYLIKRSLCSKRFRSDLCGFSLSDRADVGMTVRSNSAGKTRKRLLHRLHEALQTLCHVHELAIKYLICLRSKLKFQEPLFSFIVALALKKTSGTC